MKRYVGRREGYATLVTVDGHSLDPRLDLWNHSPTGFEWGNDGSGPAQLALAILADYFGDDEQALDCYQGFKRAVVSTLPYRGWTLTAEQIEHALRLCAA
jgi:hypothetical protein